MRGMAILAAAMTLSSCVQPESPEAPRIFHWRILKDGSQFALFDEDVRGHVTTYAARCWKANMKFDCLLLTSGQVTDARREIVPKLPAVPSILDVLTTAGYECMPRDGSNYQEHITDAERGSLTSHIVTDFSQDRVPWTSAFVTNYLSDNDVKGPGIYLNCATLTQVLRDGSEQSLGTTSLTHDMLVN